MMENDPRCVECIDHVCSCHICSNKFNTESPPKILDCGHTICGYCLTYSKENDKELFCPECKSPLTKDIDLYQTNYTLFDICQSLLQSDIFTLSAVCPFHLLRGKLYSMERNLDANLVEIRVIISKFEMIESKLRSPIHKKVLDEIEDRCKALENGKIGNTNAFFAPVEVYSRFRSSLDEIIVKLQNEERIYLSYEVNDKPKYGRITLENNTLLFHSLTLTELPNHYSVLKYQAIQDCFDRQRFGIFLKLCCNDKGVIRLVILTLFETPLLTKFIQNCTGETGSTYKGSSFTNGNSYAHYDEIVQVKSPTPPSNVLLNDPSCKKISYADVNSFAHYDEIVGVDSDYTSSDDSVTLLKAPWLNDPAVKLFRSKVPFNNSELVVQTTDEEGSFKICHLKDKFKMNNIVARVVSPEKLAPSIDYNDKSALRIIDCGLCYTY